MNLCSPRVKCSSWPRRAKSRDPTSTRFLRGTWVGSHDIHQEILQFRCQLIPFRVDPQFGFFYVRLTEPSLCSCFFFAKRIVYKCPRISTGVEYSSNRLVIIVHRYSVTSARIERPKSGISHRAQRRPASCTRANRNRVPSKPTAQRRTTCS